MEAEHLASASFTKTTLLPTGLNANVSYLLQLYSLLKTVQKDNSLKVGIWTVCHITLRRLFAF